MHKQRDKNSLNSLLMESHITNRCRCWCSLTICDICSMLRRMKLSKVVSSVVVANCTSAMISSTARVMRGDFRFLEHACKTDGQQSVVR